MPTIPWVWPRIIDENKKPPQKRKAPDNTTSDANTAFQNKKTDSKPSKKQQPKLKRKRKGTRSGWITW